MDTTSASTEAMRQLLELIRGGFTGTLLPDSLVYLRWWSSDVLDAVIVHGEDRCAAYRASEVDPRRLSALSAASMSWEQRGPVVTVVGELLSLPDPHGVRVAVRAADQRAVSHAAAELAGRLVQRDTVASHRCDDTHGDPEFALQRRVRGRCAIPAPVVAPRFETDLTVLRRVLTGLHALPTDPERRPAS